MSFIERGKGGGGGRGMGRGGGYGGGGGGTLSLNFSVRPSLLKFCSFSLQPSFGASLHILKVEIGGDAQSTGLNNLQYIVLSNHV